MPTEAAVAQVLVARYADHLPLYRQAQGLARQGIEIGREVLAGWLGAAAFEVRPVVARLREILLASVRLFADETTMPVLDPVLSALAPTDGIAAILLPQLPLERNKALNRTPLRATEIADLRPLGAKSDRTLRARQSRGGRSHPRSRLLTLGGRPVAAGGAA